MNKLNLFYQDKALLSQLKEYFDSTIREKAVDMLFAGRDVTAIPQAKILIDSVWDKMEQDFGIDKKPKENSSR